MQIKKRRIEGWTPDIRVRDAWDDAWPSIQSPELVPLRLHRWSALVRWLMDRHQRWAHGNLWSPFLLVARSIEARIERATPPRDGLQMRDAWGRDPWPYVGRPEQGEWRGLLTALALALLVLGGIVLAAVG